MITASTEGPGPAASAPGEVSVSEPAPPNAARVSLLRKVLPFVVAGLLLFFVGSRLDFDAFRHALSQLNTLAFLSYCAGWCVLLLAADALGNFAAYRLTMPGVKWGNFFLYRGASYLPALLNHHLGQAYMTYLMSRLSRIPLRRMAGATLVSYATWMGCLLGCMTIALPFSNLPSTYVPLILIAGVAYLVVIALKPAKLAAISFLAPLFEAGIRGHAIALVARLPHLGVLVLGTWGSFFFFDVNIPWGTALVYLPILLVAVTLPITPQGFGTRDTLAGIFFVSYAVGTSDAERLGHIVACTTSWGIASTLFAALLGVICGRVVSKRLAEAA